MVDTISTCACAQHKSHPETIPSQSIPPIIGGVVQHALVSPSLQIDMLTIVDETGVASIGEITDTLADIEDVPGAILAIVSAGILTLQLSGDILDRHTQVRRTKSATDSDDGIDMIPVAPSSLPAGQRHDTASDASIVTLEFSQFSPHIALASGAARRAFARCENHARPGVYLMLNDAGEAYIGMGGKLGSRIASGNQPIEDVALIVAISDINDRLDETDARALERVLWSRLVASGECKVLNNIPDGAPIDVQRYSEIEALAGQICLALRHHDLLFARQSARAVLAGPIFEPDTKPDSRPFDERPGGDVLESRFFGLEARAAKLAEDRWVLLRDSEVRIDTAPSANGTMRYKRAAFLHAGILDLAPNGRSYIVKRDVVFQSRI